MSICPLDPTILPQVTSPQLTHPSSFPSMMPLRLRSFPLGMLDIITLFLHISECGTLFDTLEAATCLETFCSLFSAVLPLPQTLPRKHVCKCSLFADPQPYMGFCHLPSWTQFGLGGGGGQSPMSLLTDQPALSDPFFTNSLLSPL